MNKEGTKEQKKYLQWWYYTKLWLIAMMLALIPFPVFIWINNQMPPEQLSLPNIYLFIFYILCVIIWVEVLSYSS